MLRENNSVCCAYNRRLYVENVLKLWNCKSPKHIIDIQNHIFVLDSTHWFGTLPHVIVIPHIDAYVEFVNKHFPPLTILFNILLFFCSSYTNVATSYIALYIELIYDHIMNPKTRTFLLIKTAEFSIATRTNQFYNHIEVQMRSKYKYRFLRVTWQKKRLFLFPILLTQ